MIHHSSLTHCLYAAVNSIQLLHFMLVVTGAALLGMASASSHVSWDAASVLTICYQQAHDLSICGLVWLQAQYKGSHGMLLSCFKLCAWWGSCCEYAYNLMVRLTLCMCCAATMRSTHQLSETKLDASTMTPNVLSANLGKRWRAERNFWISFITFTLWW